jgi:hypothetical protein
MELSRMPTSPSLRAADSDRERTVALLGDHLAAGRLDVVEFDERLSAAYSAVTLDDLDALVADLPPQPVAATTSGWRLAWQAGMSSWLVTAVVCLLVWALTSLAQGQPLYFWPGWVIGPWGLVLVAMHTLGAHRLSPRDGKHPRSCWSSAIRHSTSNQECAS